LRRLTTGGPGLLARPRLLTTGDAVLWLLLLPRLLTAGPRLLSPRGTLLWLPAGLPGQPMPTRLTGRRLPARVRGLPLLWVVARLLPDVIGLRRPLAITLIVHG